MSSTPNGSLTRSPLSPENERASQPPSARAALDRGPHRMVTFFLAIGPFNQQPFVRAAVGKPVVPMRDPNAHVNSGKCTKRGVAAVHHVSMHGNRLAISIK